MADISVAGLAKHYDATDGSTVIAMTDVSLTVASGEFVAVVGASGCGKSTLLRILAGFERASAGTVLVGGVAVAGPSSDRGVVFQDYGLFPWLTTRENVAFGPRQRGVDRKAAAALSERFLHTVGLAMVADKYPGELSGGMQQRVAIARVLANNPALLLMDEPFGALDALTRSDLQIELRRIHRQTQTTVLFVTHSIEEAIFLADRVVVMTGGAAHGVPGHIRAIVPVHLPAERDVNSHEFNEIKREISAMVHEGVDYV
ncbi:ABC transporter ATP-binding protein [Cryobacterium glaciale]|uniref:ABC transporter ATP-binding protein n=1 Tax=Cryobacterium glaciale TaxID=1259145 RepID=A0A4R8V207_9MICO|nr:ABC transporter ATP-binding protein [Cryobacterium glaciale]TFB76279.1 ABC transporter ATP-binding protein [Cryobacterium glaciale]